MIMKKRHKYIINTVCMHNQKDMMLNNQKLISRTRIPLIICKKLHSNSSYLKKSSMKLACHQYGCAAFYDPVSHRFAVVCSLNPCWLIFWEHLIQVPHVWVSRSFGPHNNILIHPSRMFLCIQNKYPMLNI